MDVVFLTSAFREIQYPQPNRPEIAFAGRSNVGKSSLINTLVRRRKLARISSKPGRTQSINFFLVDDSLYLVDLPGYGFARVPLKVKNSWRQMVESYLRNRSNLKAVVVIMDIRRNPGRGDLDLLEWLKLYDIVPLVVLTKTDKLSRQKTRIRAHEMDLEIRPVTNDSPILFSAKTELGRHELWEKIRSLTGYGLGERDER